MQKLKDAVVKVVEPRTPRTPTFVLVGLGCLGILLFLIAATIVLSLIPLYLPKKDVNVVLPNSTVVIPPGEDRYYVFDFLNSKTGITSGAGGRTVAATSETFPALIGNGVAMTVGYISACGINLPHTHPRATEFNIIMSGQFESGLFQENGARFIMHTLNAGQATVFPEGAIHFEQNLSCEPAVFVAGFNNPDPGVQGVARSFFGGLPTEVVGAGLGGLNITTVDDLRRFLPDNPALGIRLCRQRCGLSK